MEDTTLCDFVIMKISFLYSVKGSAISVCIFNLNFTIVRLDVSRRNNFFNTTFAPPISFIIFLTIHYCCTRETKGLIRFRIRVFEDRLIIRVIRRTTITVTIIRYCL